MTWHEAGILAGFACDNMPENITPSELRHYLALEQRVVFESYHGINSDACEQDKNAKHRIIADCLYRRMAAN